MIGPTASNCSRFAATFLTASMAIVVVCSCSHSKMAIPDGKELIASSQSILIQPNDVRYEADVMPPPQLGQSAKTYDVFATEQGYGASNPAHDWSIEFNRNGTTMLKGDGGNTQNFSVTLKLLEVVAAGTTHLDRPETINASDIQINYQWNDWLQESWINNASGVEQLFVVDAPQRDGDEPIVLQLVMLLSTNLEVQQQGQELLFFDQAGEQFRYRKLRVWDADGTAIPANFSLEADRLSIVANVRHAEFPVTVDPTFQTESYIKASNTEESDWFGFAVAIYSDTLVVGARWESSAATGIDGNQDDNSATLSGAVYIYVRDADGWEQQAYVKASNTEESDSFGTAVDIYENTLVVGAPYEDSAAYQVNGDQLSNSSENSGAAYVFVRESSDTWRQEAYLKPSENRLGAAFGHSVAISGNVVVVGAPRNESAFVFRRTVSDWVQEGLLRASNGTDGDYFGTSVDISGDTLIVGAPWEDSAATDVNANPQDDSAPDSGAAYVFQRSGNWYQQAYLKASNTDPADHFGSSVSISGDSIVVGAPDEDSFSNGVNGDQGNPDPSIFPPEYDPHEGAAYVFTRTGEMWRQQAYIKALNNTPPDATFELNYWEYDYPDWWLYQREYFGNAVAIHGDYLVVGAKYENNGVTGANSNPFAAHFVYSDWSSWTAQDRCLESGAAYVFRRNNDAWSQIAYLKPAAKCIIVDGGSFHHSQLGYSVDVHNASVAVGANGDDSPATGIDGDPEAYGAWQAGAAYVFNEVAIPPISLVGLEVTQALQDWQNSVELVAGKETVVRAHFESSSGNVGDYLNFRLYGYDAHGNALDPPFVENGEEAGTGEWLTIPETLTVDWRIYESAAARFDLPESWTVEGDKLFELVANPSITLTCDDKAPKTDADCWVEVAFYTQKVMNLHMINTEYRSNNIYKTTNLNLERACDQIQARYPVAEVNCIIEPKPIVLEEPWTADYPHSSTILNAVRDRKEDANCVWPQCEDFYFALTSFSACVDYLGVGCISRVDGESVFPDLGDWDSRTSWAFYSESDAPHELGHSLGLYHPTNRNDYLPLPSLIPIKIGTCGEEASIRASYPPPPYSEFFPYYTDSTETGQPWIGPVDGDDQTTVFGYNTLTNRIIPYDEVPFMSYCEDRAGLKSIAKWLDIGSYKDLASQLRDWDVQTRTQVVENIVSYFDVSGMLDLETEDAVFNPVEVRTPAFVPAPPSASEWELVVHFASAPDERQPVGLSWSPDRPAQARFFALVEYNPDVIGFTLERNGIPMAQQMKSNNTPVVTITAPQPGTVYNFNDLVLEWEAYDDDGDELVFWIDYSSDGGLSWATISSVWSASPFTVSSGMLEPTEEGLLRVIASDGFNSSSDTLAGPIIIQRSDVIFANGFE